MALTSTTLLAAITPSQLTFSVGSTATGFPAIGTVAANQPISIDGEFMFLTGVPAAGVIVVRGRGSEGTVAKTHDVNAVVTTSATPGDFRTPSSALASNNPPSVDSVVTIGQDQTITPPDANTTYYISKATAAAIVLNGAFAYQSGVVMTFISQTAAAHTITYTAGFNANTTSSDVATFSGAIGASVVVQVTPTGTLVVLSPSSSVAIG